MTLSRLWFVDDVFWRRASKTASAKLVKSSSQWEQRVREKHDEAGVEKQPSSAGVERRTRRGERRAKRSKEATAVRCL